jgi:hypothetical protein
MFRTERNSRDRADHAVRGGELPSQINPIVEGRQGRGGWNWLKVYEDKDWREEEREMTDRDSWS